GTETRQIKRILREGIDRPADVALHRLGRLSEERIWHTLATRDAVSLAKLDEHDLLRRVRRAAYREWDREMELDRTDGDIHAGTPSRSALAIRSPPTAPSRTGSAAGRPVSAAALAMASCARFSLRAGVVSGTADHRR